MIGVRGNVIRFYLSPSARCDKTISFCVQYEDDLILIPFAGSGTECLSAKNNKRNFIGFELNKKYIEIANKRLDKA